MGSTDESYSHTDEAKPKHEAKILDGHDTHGWLIAAFLREMSELSGKATFECVESNFSFNRDYVKEAWKPHVCGRKMATKRGYSLGHGK